MFRYFRQNRFLTIVVFVHFLAIVFFTAGELERVDLAHRSQFLLFRAINGILIFSCLMWVLNRPVKDGFFTLISLLGYSYCIYSSWYLPLYEFAFFQVALAMCFLDYQRKWLYQATVLSGGFAFIISQQIQQMQNWRVPVSTGRDYFFVIVICLILAIILQRYVFQERLNKSNLLMRYGSIGREATRLLHDVKGMLGSPLLVTGGMLHDQSPLSSSQQKDRLEQLNRDLEHIRDVVYHLNRLVSVNEDPESIGLLSVLKRSILSLGLRAQKIKIELPENRNIFVSPTKIESVFFNLLLNSIQAQENKQVQDPTVKIEWQGKDLIYSDNIGACQVKSSQSTSLGMTLIESDLHSMGIAFSVNISEQGMKMTMVKLGVERA